MKTQAVFVPDGNEILGLNKLFAEGWYLAMHLPMQGGYLFILQKAE